MDFATQHPFCIALVAALLAAPSSALNNTRNTGLIIECLEKKSGYQTVPELVRINHVIDGDTVQLAGGRKVRLIGINAPEVKSRSRAQQYGAKTARKRVQQLLQKTGNTAQLVPGIEPEDRHKRLLAHVLLLDGTGQSISLATQLVREGLAIATAVAPNTRCADQLAELQQIARKNRLGLWKEKREWQIDRRKLVAKEHGFLILKDTVFTLSRRKGANWLVLQQGLQVRLPDTGNDKSASSKLEKGQLVEVRGWIGRYRGQHWLTLHHWSNLVFPEPGE